MPSDLSRFFSELKRRRVYRIGAVHVVVAFAIVQAADITLPAVRARLAAISAERTP